MSETSPTNELRKEHQLVLADIAAAHEMMQGLGAGPEAPQGFFSASFRARLDMFRQGILVHFRREEECLYPAANAMVSAGARGADLLGRFFNSEAEDDMQAHQVIRTRTNEIMSLFDAGTRGELNAMSVAHLRTITGLTKSLLERHALKEDNMIFPLIERGLTFEELAAVSDRMRECRAIGDLGGREEGPGLGELNVGA